MLIEYRNMFIVNVGVPSISTGFKRLDYRTKHWDPDFFRYLERLRQKKNVIVCGCFEVIPQLLDIAEQAPVKKAGFTKEERNNFNKFLSKGWTDTYRLINGHK